MCKIKSLTKDEKLFSILLVFNLLLSYFTGYSFLWMLYEFFVTTGIYYLCFKSPITEKFSKLTKTVIGICLVILLAAPPLFIFKNNAWIYRTSESIEQTIFYAL